MNDHNLNEIYKNTYEQSPYAIFIFNLEGFIISANPEFCELTGYSLREICHEKITKILKKHDANFFCLQLKKRGSITTKINFHHKNNVILSQQVLLKFINKNHIQGLITSHHPSSEIFNLLINNDDLYKQISETIHDVIYLMDLKSQRIIYVSPTFELVWKGDPARLASADFWLNNIHPDDRDNFTQAYSEQRLTGQLDATFRIIQQNGVLRWIHARAFPVYNDQQQLYRSVGIAEDISAQVNLNLDRLKYEQILQQTFNDTIVALAGAQEQKDPYTVGHQNAVATLSTAIARELSLSEQQIKGLVFAAHLHDIGKIAIPAELLTKPAKLNTAELTYIQTHPEIGYAILKEIHFPWPIANIVHQHHERINGSGYPMGLADENILLETKIIAVADTIDAMARNRPYRQAPGMNAAMDVIRKERGILYDPAVVDGLDKLYKDNKISLYK